jgi:DNA (cytosine-5)-methyltransferase 1
LPTWRTAAEIIDWSIPCPSIFERKKPLAGNTLKRIAEGIKRYVIEAAEPFIVTYYGMKNGEFRGRGVDEPLATQTARGNRFGLVVPHIQRQFGNSIGQSCEEPLGTIMPGGGGKTALVSAFLAKHYGGIVGHELSKPLGAVTSIDHHSLTTSNLVKFKGTSKAGQSVDEPLHTVQGRQHYSEVRAFLVKYFGTAVGHEVESPLHTITGRDREAVVTVMIRGEPWVIADIGMRMLSPRELFRAQGFPDDFIIDIEREDKQGKFRKISKEALVKLCGNSVPPPDARALVAANCGNGTEIKGMQRQLRIF